MIHAELAAQFGFTPDAPLDATHALPIVRPAEVIELAAAAKLPVAHAAVMLTKESSGGHNVWGSDAVRTGGAYAKGGPVTRENYLAYRALQDAGEIGAQGVGPTQLTWPPLQREADGSGGCWNWRSNVLVGFRHLAELQRAHGVEDGFRRYNGSGAKAREYAEKSMALLDQWERRLTVPPAPVHVPAAAAAGELHLGMRNHPEVRRLQEFLRRVFPDYADGLPATGNYLADTAAAVREFQRRARILNADGSVPDGRNVGARTRASLAQHGYR